MQFKSKRAPKTIAVVAATVTALSLAACSGTSGSTSSSAASKYTLKIADFPVMELAALYVGRDQGIFAANGLTLDAVQISGAGAAMIPAVVQGTIDIAPSNVLSVMAAQQNGQDVKCFALITRRPADGRALPLLVPANSPIKSAKDLVGKKVAVNALGGANDLILRVWLASQGVDPKSVTFVPTAFPDMSQVLSNGTVAAALTDEPYTSIAIENGATVLEARPYQAIANTPAFSCWATTSKQIANNSGALTAFVKSMNESNKIANSDRAAVTKTLVNTMKFSESVSKAATVPQFDTTISVDDMKLWANEAQKYGMLKVEFNPANAVSPITGK